MVNTDEKVIKQFVPVIFFDGEFKGGMTVGEMKKLEPVASYAEAETIAKSVLKQDRAAIGYTINAT